MTDLTPLIPELFLIGWTIVILLVDLFFKRKSRSLTGYLSLIGLAITGFLLFRMVGYQGETGYPLYGDPGGKMWGGMFTTDGFALFFKIIILGSAFFAVGSSFGIVGRMSHHRGEYYALLLFSTIGMLFLVSAKELITLYVGLELTTIPLFILAAYHKTSKASAEAGIKYLVIGAASSAVLLYGLSIIYGLTGTTYLQQIAVNLAIYSGMTSGSILALSFAMMMIFVGLAFKMAVVPFHMWAPDVYEGAPTPITAFLSVGSKAAGLAAIIRIFCIMFYDYGLENESADWSIIVALVAAVTMILGNVLAIRQSSIKRMLAYSSIAQAGYILIGLAAAPYLFHDANLAFRGLGVASAGFYMFAYLFANMGAFAVVTIYSERTGSDKISDYAGLSKSSPVLAALMALFLLSLAGIPPLVGFLAKYYVFAAAVRAGLTWLVILALLMAVVSLYYYANIIRLMYLRPDSNPHKVVPSFPAGLVLSLCGLGVVIFGILPQSILELALAAAVSFTF